MRTSRCCTIILKAKTNIFYNSIFSPLALYLNPQSFEFKIYEAIPKIVRTFFWFLEPCALLKNMNPKGWRKARSTILGQWQQNFHVQVVLA